jgi:hypothetical protein
VADPLVVHDDLEMFLTAWYRTALAGRPEPVCEDVVVDRVEPGPDEEWPEKLLVIRDDGTARTSFLTGEASIGLTVFAGSKQNPKDAKDLARIVLALAAGVPSADPENPVAALLDSNGPYMVPEAQPRARVYSNVSLAVAGRAL